MWLSEVFEKKSFPVLSKEIPTKERLVELLRELRNSTTSCNDKANHSEHAMLIEFLEETYSRNLVDLVEIFVSLVEDVHESEDETGEYMFLMELCFSALENFFEEEKKVLFSKEVLEEAAWKLTDRYVKSMSHDLNEDSYYLEALAMASAKFLPDEVLEQGEKIYNHDIWWKKLYMFSGRWDTLDAIRFFLEQEQYDTLDIFLDSSKISEDLYWPVFQEKITVI